MPSTASTSSAVPKCPSRLRAAAPKVVPAASSAPSCPLRVADTAAPAVEARASDPQHACAQGHTHPACTFSRCRRGVLRGGARADPRRAAPHRGEAQAASAHRAKRRHRPPTPRRHSGGRARLAHRRSPQCSQKSGDRPTKTRSFCAITPRFLRRGGSAAAKGRKAARNHGCNHRKDKNINFSPPNHQQKHVFTPCTSGEMQAEIRTFRRLGRKQGGGGFILFQGFVLSLRGAQWAKNARFGCAIPRYSCKSDDKNRLFHLRKPLIPF